MLQIKIQSFRSGRLGGIASVYYGVWISSQKLLRALNGIQRPEAFSHFSSAPIYQITDRLG